MILSVSWEGDTLVVETRGFNPQQSFRGASENLQVTERFSRVSDSEILYSFTVEDSTVFSQAFTGELMFNARPARESMYEYACHGRKLRPSWNIGGSQGTGTSGTGRGALAHAAGRAAHQSHQAAHTHCL